MPAKEVRVKAAAVVANILKREGVEFLIGYPVNPIIEAAAEVDIRTIIVRQERTGLHMADAVSRMTSGERIGVFAMQHGPGAENSFGGVAQAFGDSVPIVVLPEATRGGCSTSHPTSARFSTTSTSPNGLSRSSRPTPCRMRCAARSRRCATVVRVPCWSNCPTICCTRRCRTAGPTRRHRACAADPIRAMSQSRGGLVGAERPVIYAGQGVHYARAWPQLKALAELLEAPVTTSLQGKSAFPETHPLSLGSGGRSISKQLHEFLNKADLIFGIGCSFSITNYGVAMPKGARIAHATLDPADINKDVPAELALVGDAGLTLDALLIEVRDRLGAKPRGRAAAVAQQIKQSKSEWLAQWMPRLKSESTPLSPYRVIWDLLHTVDVANTIITHDAGSPRDQLSPFWETTTPLTYIGWGKTHAARLRTGARDGCEARSTGQAVHQRLG